MTYILTLNMDNLSTENITYGTYSRSEAKFIGTVVRIADDAQAQHTFEAEALPHTDVLFRTALRMTKNKLDAEDLLQDTFERAYRYWNKFKLGTNCHAWLHRIITNMFYNHCRSNSRLPMLVNLDNLEDTHLQDQLTTLKIPETPERQLFDKSLGNNVKKAIEELPDDLRLVMKLLLLEGLSYKEIASMTELQLGTVKSKLYRGRLLLRKKLNYYANNNRRTRGHTM